MKNVILFGTGKYFNHKRDILRKYHVCCIIDNKVPEGNKGYFEDTTIPLMNPQSLDIHGMEEIYLMSMHFVSMWKELVEIGINPSRIVYPFFEKPYFQSDDVVDECIESIVFEKEQVVLKNKDGEVGYISSAKQWDSYLRQLYRKRYPLIEAIAQMETKPISTQFATERGIPIDRIYIDKFLEEHSAYIVGDVLEIEDSSYTKQYGGNRVKNMIVMDVSSTAAWVDFNANIETGDGIRESIADCFILTQTLMYVFDLKATAKNICRLLRKGGVALITCSGISQNSIRCMDHYGAYFNFNAAVFEKMFADENVTVLETGSYGNVKTVSAHIAGLCYEDLKEEDFFDNDKYYPLIVYAVVKKNG